MEEAARFIEASIVRHGGTAERIPWEHSFPYVVGEMAGGPARLLHFNHYDVEIEPAGNDADLLYPPFDAVLEDGRLYARGAADDKGALMSRIHAASAFRLAGVDLPVTVRFLAEGKRRLDSPGLPGFVEAHADRLRADGVLWENSWRDEQGRPLLKLGEKGLVYLELVNERMVRDGSSQNAAVMPNALAELVAGLGLLIDPSPGGFLDRFSESAQVPSDGDLDLLRSVGFDSSTLLKRMGVGALVGASDEKEAAVRVRTIPTVTITGIEGGDIRDDVTLNLPGRARAKIEIRILAGQEPDDVVAQVRKELDDSGFGHVKLRVLAATRAHSTPSDDPFVTLVAEAARAAYGCDPVIEPLTPLVGNQGSIRWAPIVGVGVGRAWAASDANQHIYIDDYRAGVRHIVHVMALMSDASRYSEVAG
jgi:acetylornithine deacetylase/succinyl-diaminopimelate desuccinylase-like protein